MKTVCKQYANIPEWALCYIINNDDSGMTESEKLQANSFLWGLNETAESIGGEYIISCDDMDGGFSWYPEFGLPCNVYECTVLFVQDQEENQS